MPVSGAAGCFIFASAGGLRSRAGARRVSFVASSLRTRSCSARSTSSSVCLVMAGWPLSASLSFMAEFVSLERIAPVAIEAEFSAAADLVFFVRPDHFRYPFKAAEEVGDLRRERDEHFVVFARRRLGPDQNRNRCARAAGQGVRGETAGTEGP